MYNNSYLQRHIGLTPKDIKYMLDKIGVSSPDELMERVIPDNILDNKPLNIPKGISEKEYDNHIRSIIAKNKVLKSQIGMGYYNSTFPAVIRRNIFENPAWYTSYTPYQAEISQGRLEALLNFQTMVNELTAMPLSNASLLDEATAAAEAMGMMAALRKRKEIKSGKNILFVDTNMFPQTIDVIQTRADSLGIDLTVGPFDKFDFNENVFGAILQYPAGDGKLISYKTFTQKAHDTGIKVAVAADLLSLALLTPPGEWGADIVFGTSQRFGLPMAYGGPHAAYFAVRSEYKRQVPGRIIGVSQDVHGNPAIRMALQTREQHIKREKATSNICTAQALLATIAGMYAVWHGKEGLKKIASEVHSKAVILSEQLKTLGFENQNDSFFDTIRIPIYKAYSSEDIQNIAVKKGYNFRYFKDDFVGISTDEPMSTEDINNITEIFAELSSKTFKPVRDTQERSVISEDCTRKSDFLQQAVFNNYHSETEMMRYIKKLERRDFSLTQGMIPLGSCTMKLNAASLMLPVTFAGLGNIHPFVPANQSHGYSQLINELKTDLLEITGFDDITLQPNSGAAGEYTGLLMIRAYQNSIDQGDRNITLIPASAHGTNPASAVMAGMTVKIVKCDDNGNIDMDDLKAKSEKYADQLSAIMITYPSTHGVFEISVKKVCEIIHKNGGQVYLDGANLNAQVGYTNPAIIGADVCHLNLHKTFGIPHGGGGPGVGPVAVAKHLADFLPGHRVVKTGGAKAIQAVASAPYGSASVLPITHGYIKMLGGDGLKVSTQTAILNANYMASRLSEYYEILYTGDNGRVAHEMIIDCRMFKKEAGITEADIAKRLMDYGFHAPTLSFPVHGTLMAEPTESESLKEIDRFIDAMVSIYHEIQEIKDGKADQNDNVLKNAPHSEQHLLSDDWTHPYSRTKAAYPVNIIRENKFQIPVGRVDNAYGDRNLVCTCAPISDYE
ncbi:MAG: aminomethyl-transferring glycine dehydrogenase [Bacteroidota bacterium]|nr:aminomethyl-transferring glycine dehydrogenase [Bacteroidota bacterium]